MVEQRLSVSDVDIVPPWVYTFNYVVVGTTTQGKLGLKCNKVGSVAIMEK